MNTAALITVRLFDVARTALALVGLVALTGFALPSAERDAFLETLPWLAAQSAGDETAAAAAAPGGGELALEQRALTDFIARRYRVSEVAVGSFVDSAYRAGARHSIDPLLILAVMAIESRYNPVAKSNMGAKGLMQVIPRFHLEKLADHGGELALLEPEVNIAVGAQILREYMDRFGDWEAALQMYAGALDEPTAQYTAKVMGEKARLEALRQKARKQQSA